VCVEGVLLEETVRTCLGKEGELALIDEGAFNPVDRYDTRRQRSLAYSQSQREAANLKRESGQTKEKRKSKRTKVKSEDEEERVGVKELVGEEGGRATTKGKKRGSLKKNKKHREKDQAGQQVAEG